MGKDSSDIIRYFLFKNTPNIIPMLFPLCEVGFICCGIVQMCTPCPGSLNRRAGTISTPLYTFSLHFPQKPRLLNMMVAQNPLCTYVADIFV